MARSQITAALLTVVLSLGIPQYSQALPESVVGQIVRDAQQAVEEGDTDRARALLDRSLELTVAAPATERWTAIMAVAWLESITGGFQRSIELSNEALELASKVDDPFMLGRSLCWLGWAYAATGRYEAARSFYTHAREIGAPAGKITLPHVWGLATQELGRIAFVLGDAVTARSLLTKTLEYARENKIQVGVSESAVALGEVALAAGNLSEAESLADEAVQSAYECNCNPENTARALVFKGRAALHQAGSDPDKQKTSRKNLERALAFAKDRRLDPSTAQALIALASPEAGASIDERLTYAHEALEVVEKGGLETKGLAYLTAATSYLDLNSPALAEQYLRHGMKVTAETLRISDLSALLNEEAALQVMKGEYAAAITALEHATELASLSGDRRHLFDLQVHLSDSYLQAGAEAISLRWARRALLTLEDLLSRDAAKDAKLKLENEKIRLADRVVSISTAIGAGISGEPG